MHIWVSLHTCSKLPFQIPPTAFLSKPPNMMFANNSAYIVCNGNFKAVASSCMYICVCMCVCAHAHVYTVDRENFVVK